MGPPPANHLKSGRATKVPTPEPPRRPATSTASGSPRSRRELGRPSQASGVGHGSALPGTLGHAEALTVHNEAVGDAHLGTGLAAGPTVLQPCHHPKMYCGVSSAGTSTARSNPDKGRKKRSCALRIRQQRRDAGQVRKLWWKICPKISRTLNLDRFWHLFVRCGSGGREEQQPVVSSRNLAAV